MPPSREPWFKVKVGLISSDKVGALPNDSARWGWVKVLAEAKTQRRMGLFASTAHLGELIGRQARFIPQYVTVGLLHVAPAMCERCRASYSDATAPEVVVHDYRREQRDPTDADRQADWRHGNRNGVGNADRNGDRNAPLTGAGDDGDSDYDVERYGRTDPQGSREPRDFVAPVTAGRNGR